MANGIPSSRRQISVTAATFASVSLNPLFAIWARSTNSFTASDEPAPPRSCSSPTAGTWREGTAKILSPRTVNASRLVAMMRRSVDAFSNRSTTSAHAESTSSQLSSTSSSCLPDRCALNKSPRSCQPPRGFQTVELWSLTPCLRRPVATSPQRTLRLQKSLQDSRPA